MRNGLLLATALLLQTEDASSFIPNSASLVEQQHVGQVDNSKLFMKSENSNRRDVLSAGVLAAGSFFLSTTKKTWAAGDLPDSLDIDNFLKYGQVANPMGVSGQAGKSRPETGVVLRDGSEVSRDSKSGSVLAEILVGQQPVAVLANFVSPWPLATGTVFDVECRNAKTGDGAFLAVSQSGTGGKTISSLPDSFFVNELFRPTGRFSFYGPPTDVKVRGSRVDSDTGYRYIDLSFSTLSQSTQTEIPRRAIVAATIPQGTEEAVMLVGSAAGSRWKKGAAASVQDTVASFRAIPAPKSGLKIRAKERANTNA